MSFFDRFRSRPLPRFPAAPPRPPSFNLSSAPSFQPLPIQSGDPIDAEVSSRWNDFQRRNTDNPQWSTFLAELSQKITDGAATIAKLKKDLAGHVPHSEFRP